MKTISKLRREVLRDHLTEKMEENQANLYELNKQLVLEAEAKLRQCGNAKYEQNIGSVCVPTQIPLQIDILMDNISMLQTKLDIVQRNISKSK